MVLIWCMAVLQFHVGDFPEILMTKRQIVPSRSKKGQEQPCFASFPLSVTWTRRKKASNPYLHNSCRFNDQMVLSPVLIN